MGRIRKDLVTLNHLLCTGRRLIVLIWGYFGFASDFFLRASSKALVA
jgi:hypothetical protein